MGREMTDMCVAVGVGRERTDMCVEGGCRAGEDGHAC